MGVSNPEFDKLFLTPELLTPGNVPVRDVNAGGDYFGYWLRDGDVSGNESLFDLQDGVNSHTDFLEFDGSTTAYVDCGPIDLSSISQFTITAEIYMDGSGTDEHVICSNWGGVNGASVLFRADPSAANQLEAFIVLQSNTQHGGNFTDLDLIDNQWHICTLRFNADDGSGLTCFLDSTESATSFTTSTALDINAASNNLFLGSTPHQNTDGLTGGIRSLQLDKRALSDSEILELHADLYRDLKPKGSVFIPFPAAAASGFQPFYAMPTRIQTMQGMS